MHHQIGITRRSLLYSGAAVGMAVAIGVRPAAAAGAAPGTPEYLTRSAYTGLAGSTFAVETGARPVTLRLESVADVAGAATERALAGHEDAFALTFSGPLSAPLDSGIHTLHHPSLGSFELFSSPVDAPGPDRNYEVVVDRSVGVARARSEAPRAPERPAVPEEPGTPESPGKAARSEGAQAPAPILRKASLRRAGRWARCEVVLHRTVDAERVRCRLIRTGRVIATAARAVTDRRAAMRLEAARPLRPGTYALVVTAVHPDGSRTSERTRVTLR